MTVLAAHNLVKEYRGKTVVNGVSLEVASNEVVGLLGPNGAGKTTCFYLIVGLIPVDAGSVTIDGNDLTSIPMHGRAKLGLGYLAQEPSVFRRMSARDNIMAILETRPELDQSQREAISEELLYELGISHLRDAKALRLSGGERRRLEIARALAVEPRFILLDEPFAGVDPLAVLDIKKIVTHLRERNIGVLITDHNVRETLDICDRAYIIHQGAVMAEGEPGHIMHDPQVRSVYLGEHFTM